jgi:hypothetical protein
VIEVKVGGSLVPELAGDGVAFRTVAGAVGLSYRDLHAYDALGRTLPSSLGLAGDRIVITTDLTGAAYPVVIDPLIASEQATLKPAEITPDDCFSGSVAISADTIVVGAPWQSGGDGVARGAAYVYVRDGGTWTEQAKLLASDAAADDYFGSSIAIAGDTAIIGALRKAGSGGNEQGAAYVFVRSGGTWTEEAKLVASDGAASDGFGGSVALSDDTAAVGAPGKNGAHGSEGAAYVFGRSAGVWTEQANLRSPAPGPGAGFGSSVSVSGDVTIIGAPRYSHGAAYVFLRDASGWSLGGQLEGADPTVGWNFGCSVSLSGSTALVGASLDLESEGSSPGAAYAFTGSGGAWTPQARLLAPDADDADYFGWAVSLEGDTAVIGAPMRGKVYVFSRTAGTWTYQTKLVPYYLGNNLGGAVALSGDTAVVGHTCYGTGNASVFILRLQQGDPCTSATFCPSGLCVDGVCCDRACDGQCEACDVAGHLGVCTPVSGPPHGARAACAGAGPCQARCNGIDVGQCHFPGADLVCRDAQCSEGVATSTALCDGAGQCGASVSTSCGDYACGPTQCLTSCTSSLDCAPGRDCAASQCVPWGDGGAPTDAKPHLDGTSDADSAARAPDGGDEAIRGRGCSCRQADTPASPVGLLVGLTVAWWCGARRRRR